MNYIIVHSSGQPPIHLLLTAPCLRMILDLELTTPPTVSRLSSLLSAGVIFCLHRRDFDIIKPQVVRPRAAQRET